MTYCVALHLHEGLVFLSDSRTNAGVDQISTYRKMTVYEAPGDRVLVLMTAGNLAITQAAREAFAEATREDGKTIWNVNRMNEAAMLLGDAIRRVHERDAEALKGFGVDFNANFILGGQIKGEKPRLFNVYSAGNYVEAQEDVPYFQIGESKYGKPIIDRVITMDTPLDEAAKCALISMDSTLRSNISVGLPLDLMVYAADSLAVTRFARLDERNEYYQMIRTTWGKRLRQVFEEIPDPVWVDRPADAPTERGAPLRVVSPTPDNDPVPAQTLAQQV
ncbi:peptidase [Piscinibacterium candidicorallinum]|jgi:putative proteasome-type protease|uniref:Peptidase n=1 Tax=Piscinibacterium candidicorallinum TaxID=1793872 RepID=A0ABV7GYC2_9BURK